MCSLLGGGEEEDTLHMPYLAHGGHTIPRYMSQFMLLGGPRTDPAGRRVRADNAGLHDAQ